MPSWDASLYLRFENERTQPCIDLAARIEMDSVEDAIDLGCGPGNSTKVLHDRFPNARLKGMDNSPAMIERAKHDYPNIPFGHADAETWTADRPVDLLFSNAVFQWIGNHEALFPRLMQQLRPGGTFAVQMPRNFKSPVHQILRQLAASPQWSAQLGPAEPYWVHPPGFYYDVLTPYCSKIDLWETDYIHILPDHDAIVDWYKGTALRAYLEALKPQDQPEFLDQFRAKVVDAYPPMKDGRVLFPFLRIFFIGVR